MAFLTKIQDIVTALGALTTAIGQIPAIEAALTSFNDFLDNL